MKHYNKIKNLIIAGMVGFIVYNYILPHIPVLTDLLAVGFVVCAVLAFLGYLDAKKKAKIKEKRELKAKRDENEKSA